MIGYMKCHLCSDEKLGVEVAMQIRKKGDRWIEIRPTCIECLSSTAEMVKDDEEDSQ